MTHLLWCERQSCLFEEIAILHNVKPIERKTMSQAATVKSSWKAPHVALMILGFIFFWPLGLAMLAYIIWGDEMREMFQDMKSRMKSHLFAPFV